MPRKLAEELLSLMGKKVVIETQDGRRYEGELTSIDERLNVMLSKVAGEESTVKLLLNGAFVRDKGDQETGPKGASGKTGTGLP